MAGTERWLGRERALATLSHEMRTPLNGVLGMAGLLARTPLDPTQSDYLHTLRESADHLLSLVNDILDYAKLDAAGIDLEPAAVDLETLLQGVCELLSPRAHAGGIEIACAVDPRLPPVMADDGRLRQILFNLAGNAVKMTAEGGVLVTAERVAAGPGRVRIAFRVSDTGPGVPPAEAARIFDEFTQTEAGARAGGAGLGLAIVRRLADAFEGSLQVESPERGGAVFTFQADFDALPRASGRRPLAGLSVAIASPSRIVREAARRQVEASGGWALTFDSVPDHLPEVAVVLVDSTGDGLPPPPSGAPALVLLAPEARIGIAPAREAGYAGYLIKPLRRRSLVERVLACRKLGVGAAPPRRRPVPAEDERARGDAPLGLRVLLAEDNPVNALLAQALLKHEGCAVTRVADGEEALAAMLAQPFDAVLMDMRMPKLDGLSAARAARAAGLRLPIIALTANAFEEDRRACLEAGMTDFLAKPLDADGLRATLLRCAGPGRADGAAEARTPRRA